MRKKSTTQKIKEIAKRRRLGDIKMVSVETGYSQSHVSRVLRGEKRNESIVDSAYYLITGPRATA